MYQLNKYIINTIYNVKPEDMQILFLYMKFLLTKDKDFLEINKNEILHGYSNFLD